MAKVPDVGSAAAFAGVAAAAASGPAHTGQNYPGTAAAAATAGVGGVMNARTHAAMASAAVAGATIGINNALFEAKLAEFKKAGTEIEELSSLRDPSVCKNLVLSDWVDLCQDLGEIMMLYKRLISKDVEEIKASQKALNDADKYRANSTNK